MSVQGRIGENQSGGPVRRSLLRRAFRWLAYSVLGAVLFLGVLAGATQTQFFRDRLRSIALSQLDSLLTAQAYLGEIRGNLVTGFSIDSVALSMDGSPILTAERVNIRYDLFRIPGKMIAVDEFLLVRPVIHIWTSPDGSLNLTRMVRPNPADTVAPSPFDWNISLTQFRIDSGMVTFVDSAALLAAGHGPEVPGTVEYHNIALRDVMLDVSVHLSPTEKRAEIRRFAFYSDAPHFTLAELEANIRITDSDVRVRGLNIVTGGSRLAIDASMGNVNLFGGIDLAALEHSPVDLRLKADPFDFEEFKMFLPAVSFLYGPVWVDAAVAGEFGSLDVRSMKLRLAQSELNAVGKVSRLHEPSKLTLAVEMNDGVIDPADPLILLPEFNLPDFRQLGPFAVSLGFSGQPTDFRAHASLASTQGAVQCSSFTLRIGGPAMLIYSGSLSVADLNLAAVTGNEALAGRLTGTASVEGEGVTLATVRGTMQARLDSSEFRGLPASGTRIDVDARGESITILSYLRVGEMRSSLSGEIGRRGGEVDEFAVHGEVDHLDLQVLSGSPHSQSNISFGLDARGSGTDLAALSLDGVVHLAPSVYETHELDSTTITVSLHGNDPTHRVLAINARELDASLEGSFDLGSFTSLVELEVLNIQRLLGDRFRWLDTALVAGVDRDMFARSDRELARSLPPIDVRYRLAVNNLRAVSVILGKREFDGRGTVQGVLRGGVHDFSVSGELSDLQFYYGSADSGVLIEDGEGSFALAHGTTGDVLHDATVDVRVRARDIHISQDEFDSVAVTFTLRDSLARYEASTRVNGVQQIALQGSAQLLHDTVAVTLDRGGWRYRDLAWDAQPGAHLQVSSEGIRIDDLVVRRGVQTLAVNGMLRRGGVVAASLEGEGLALGDFWDLLPGREGEAGSGLTGTGAVRGQLRGTLREPEFAISFTTGELLYQNVSLGGLEGFFFFKDSLLDVSVYLRELAQGSSDTPELVISGQIPLNIHIPAEGEMVTDLPVNLKIISNGIDVGILDPLLPTMQQLRGSMVCDLSIGGSLQAPRYAGSIQLSDCIFLFVPNNIVYTFDGRFEAQGERIRVVDATIRNVPGDVRGSQRGSITIAGGFTVRDLTPGDFDLSARGSLLVVKETTRKSSLSVYGNLFAEIGTGGLRFTGSLDQSLLTGDLLIRNSSLVFPPTQGEVRQQEAFSVPVIAVDDTSLDRGTHMSALAERYFGSSGAGMGSPFEERTGILGNRSFMDGLRYDLRIETSGSSSEIRMIFDPLSGEELVSGLSGKFSITGDGRQWFGDLRVERAYYNFLKRFDATGTIRFRGDLMDPEMDVIATYKGTRTLRDTLGTEKLENVKVDFSIRGTRYKPKSEFSMSIDDVDYLTYNGPKSNDVQSDAIQFIVYGSFPLTAAQKGQVPTDVQRMVSGSLVSGASSLLTGALSEFLRTQTGFINSVEFRYQAQGSLTSSADIRLSGVLFSGYWRYGGQILDDPLSNANFSLLYSFDAIFGNPSLRNFMFELERRVERLPLGGVTDLKRVNSARLFYRFSF